MNILIFGTGEYYQRYKKIPNSSTNIVAFLDNNKKLQGQILDGKEIMSPKAALHLEYDSILLLSSKAVEMKEQLLEMGVPEDKILYWEQFRSDTLKGVLRLYSGKNKISYANGKKILIISIDLNYNGGSIAAIHAAEALLGNNTVVLAVPDGNPRLIKEVTEKGIDVVVSPALPYINKEELIWIEQFDVVLVNVYKMIRCACEISKSKPVLWWIHEASAKFSGVYDDIGKRFKECVDKADFDLINVMAVSSIAQDNFNYYYPGVIKRILPYGIPDERKKIKKSKKEKIVFAIIGYVCELKNQNIFIEAIMSLNSAVREKAEFWIIGKINSDPYANTIREMVANAQEIKIWGELAHNDLAELYEQIDVVVCPSKEDSLPLVMTEGMMYEKVCIASDSTGTKDYIKDGYNGFVCKTDDVQDLSNKMTWVIKHSEYLEEMGQNARKIYENNFSIESFTQNLENALDETIKSYRK